MNKSIKAEVADILPRLPKMTPERLIKEAEIGANQHFDQSLSEILPELPEVLTCILYILLDGFDYHSNKDSDQAEAARAIAAMAYRLTRLSLVEFEGVDFDSPLMKPRELYFELEESLCGRNSFFRQTPEIKLENFLGDMPEMLIDAIAKLFEGFDYNNQSMSHRAIAIRMLMAALIGLKTSLADWRSSGPKGRPFFEPLRPQDRDTHPRGWP